jgi:hypothetical protein
LGGGEVAYDPAAGRGRLVVPATPPGQYTNAQLDDYHAGPAGRLRRRVRLADRAPLRLSLRARASHPEPIGTLGFGFWNEPFSIAGGVLSTPNVCWFFYASPPSDMALAPGVPGRGWKAATLNTGRMPGFLLVPAALVAIALTRVPGLGRPIMSLARRFAVAHEALLDDVPLTDWHTYQLDWRPGEARFYVDGRERLRSPAPPAGPLGFVLWIDNQFAIASAGGRFGFGLRPLPEPQWLEVDALRLEPLATPSPWPA